MWSQKPCLWKFSLHWRIVRILKKNSIGESGPWLAWYQMDTSVCCITQQQAWLFLFLFIAYSLVSVSCIAGSPHANLNQNNLKYGTDNSRIQAQLQEPTTPPQSPNKNSGQAEKIVLLVCNRACAGQQGRRYQTALRKLDIDRFSSNWLKLFDLCAPRRFGNPFILYLERTVTWDVLQKEILEKMRHLLRPGVLVQVFFLVFFLCPDNNSRHCQVWGTESITFCSWLHFRRKRFKS